MQPKNEIAYPPVGWRTAAMHELTVRSQYGLSLRGESEGTYPILRMNCQKNGRVTFDNLQFVDLDQKVFEAFSLERGDILFNRTNSIELVGRSAIFDHDRPTVFASYLVRVSVNRTAADPRFVNYFLNWEQSQAELKKVASRSVGQANINANKLMSFKIALPPLHEQAIISDALDLVTDAVTAEQATGVALSTLKRATMRNLFSNGLRGKTLKETDAGSVPENWRLAAISELGRVVTGNTPPTKVGEYYANGRYAFISPGDLDHGSRIIRTEKQVSEAGLRVSRPLPRGTSCFVCIGSTIGKVGLTVDETSTTNQQINSVIPSDAYDPVFVFHLLTYYSDYVRRRSSPSPIPILTKGAFEQIAIPVTEDRDEQSQIAAIVDSIDGKIALHKEKSTALEALFTSLLNKLMTGEVRVDDLNLDALAEQQSEAA